MTAFVFLILFIGFFNIVVCVNAVRYIFFKKPPSSQGLQRVAEVFLIIVAPSIFLLMVDFGNTNDCCNAFGSAIFSPSHRLSIYLLIGICMIGYLVSTFTNHPLPPLLELLINVLLVIAILLNIALIVHLFDDGSWSLVNISVIILFVQQLTKRSRLLLTEMENGTDDSKQSWAYQIVSSSWFKKFPFLLALCSPVLGVMIALLYLFGQKPDAIISAFTETYHLGFSKWDYMCDNVTCGGHYLCSVAANGHKVVVKPIRYGKRGGNWIICNRQLLISNAFEDLLKEKLPVMHRIIRRKYDKVGDLVHQYYSVFNIRWISDMIYFIMKPAEWFFLMVLYLVDRRPECRIAKQYV